jgi:hypothetical protein
VNLHTRIRSVACCVAFLTCVGCNPDNAPLTPGQVSVRILNISDSEIVAELGNGLDHEIQIDGRRWFSFAIDVMPTEAQVTCGGKGGVHVSMFSFNHGPSNWITVAPSKRVKVIVDTDLPKKFKGGDCRLELMLKGDTIVGPSEKFKI